MERNYFMNFLIFYEAIIQLKENSFSNTKSNFIFHLLSPKYLFCDWNALSSKKIKEKNNQNSL